VGLRRPIAAYSAGSDTLAKATRHVAAFAHVSSVRLPIAADHRGGPEYTAMPPAVARPSSSRIALLLAGWSTTLLDHLLPPHCLLCGLESEAGRLCAPCRADLPRSRHHCRQCGLPLRTFEDDDIALSCGACLRSPPRWRQAVAALDYRFPVDRLVCRFKFRRDLACGAVLKEELLAAVLQRAGPLPELIVPVPLHRWRQAGRAFNQSELLARYLGRSLGLPVASGLLLRARRTRAQSGLDAADRRRNVRGAFRCPPARAALLQGRTLALVDDVLTTGTTLAECCRTLQRAGAGGISVWVAARASAAACADQSAAA
jgi:ComF family protein